MWRRRLRVRNRSIWIWIDRYRYRYIDTLQTTKLRNSESKLAHVQEQNELTYSSYLAAAGRLGPPTHPPCILLLRACIRPCSHVFEYSLLYSVHEGGVVPKRNHSWESPPSVSFTPQGPYPPYCIQCKGTAWSQRRTVRG